MKSYVEQLPVKIRKDGEDYYLRIKPRACAKKWWIRYIGKRTDHQYTFEAKVRGYTYKTIYQCCGANLEMTARKALKELKDF